MGLATMGKMTLPSTIASEIKFGESQISSYCSYQLTHTCTEANFLAALETETELAYPRFTLNPCCEFVLPDILDDSEKALSVPLLWTRP